MGRQEYRIEKWGSRVTDKILKQLGVKERADSLAECILAGQDNRRVHDQFDSLYRLVDSVYNVQYINRDTVGESNRYRMVFDDRMQNMIGKYIEAHFAPDDIGQIWIVFTPKKGYGLFYLTRICIPTMDADGYAIYDNRIQIAVFDPPKAARRMIRLNKMKKYPYNLFRPMGIWGEGNYDGSLDVYRLEPDDSVQFVGRGYLDRNHNFYPEKVEEN